MSGVSHHLRVSSSLPSLIRRYGGVINSLRRFSSQSDGFSGGRLREQGPVPGDSEENNNSGIPNSSPSPVRSLSDLKASLRKMRANGPSSYENFAPPSRLKKNSPSELDFLREIILDEGRRPSASGIFPHFHHPNLDESDSEHD